MRRLSSSGQLSSMLTSSGSSPSPPPGAGAGMTTPTTPHESSALLHQIEEWMRVDPHLAAAVGVVRALTEVIRTSPAATIMGLREELQAEVEKLKASMPGSVTIASGCELFMRFVTRTTLDALEDFSLSKARLVQRGEQFSRRLAQSRDKIAELALPFIRDGAVVLVHGFSRVVTGVLANAAAHGVSFRVIATEGRPDNAGFATAAALRESGISVEIIMDAAVASIMDQVDMCLCGSEAIVENGGVINKIGSFQVSIVAHEFSKPFYVAAESFKFFRLYPLSQSEIPQRIAPFKLCATCHRDVVASSAEKPAIPVYNPTSDYTPPSFITLLFTELGVLTPSAVSDELIRLYA